MMFLNQRLDDCIHRALQHFIQFVQRQVDPVISDTPLRKIIGADALGPVAGADQNTTRFRLLALLLGLRSIQQLGLQQSHGAGSILVLGALVLTLDHDSRRNVR